MRRLAALTTAAVVALTLTACNSPTADDTEVEDELGVPADPESGDEAQADAVPGGGPIPEPGECLDLPPTEENVWTVADAGVVSAGDAQGVLTADVQPAAGWEHEVDDSGDDDDLVVTFRSEGQTYRLELESDDGRVEAELCAED